MTSKRELERALEQLRGPESIDKRELPKQSIAHVLSDYPFEPVPGVDGVVLIDGELHWAMSDWIEERVDE